MKVPYHFIWSDKYQIFANVLKYGIESYSDIFEDKSEHYPQYVFDQSMNKAPGHFLCGCNLKLVKTLELLKTLPENSYFIFSDADIIIFPQRGLDKIVEEGINTGVDIMFMREAPERDCSNIGFSLIKVCDANRKLFEESLRLMEAEPSGLDQEFVNKALKTYTGKHQYFLPALVGTSSTLISYQNNDPSNFSSIINNIVVFQALCNPENGTDSAIVQKLQQYQMFGIEIIRTA
jgi:hypothetical protein